MPLRKLLKLFKTVILFICLLLIYKAFENVTMNHRQNERQEEIVFAKQLEQKVLKSKPKEKLAPYFDRYYKLLAERGDNLNEPGQGGKPVILFGDEKIRGDKSFKETAVNIVASDKIPAWRTLKDLRLPLCHNITYGPELPSATAIIIFHNEDWSLLQRTIHSIVNRSPPQYLKEVLLVDDASDTVTRPYLGRELDEYISNNWPEPAGFVKIVRQPIRQGLIRTRSRGIREAIGDVVIVLDSHCEVTDGWLEPLLARIHEHRTAIVTPEMYAISAQNLEFWEGGAWSWAFTGSFKWDLRFEWIRIKQTRDVNHVSSIEPVRSPTMVGCVFAMRRDYFLELGGYDEGMDIWGGENIELPFRAWMCGGSLEIIPCSKAGHIWKPFHTYSSTGDTMSINSKRVAEVWMDDYKHYFYEFIPNMKEYKLPANIEKQHELRRKLNCKSFDWYLENVAPFKFVPLKHAVIYGQIRNGKTGLCLSKPDIGPFSHKTCSTEKDYTQMFAYAKDNRLRTEYRCITAEGKEGEEIIDTDCTDDRKRMEWQHSPSGGQFKHTLSGKCIEAQIDKAAIVLKTCSLDQLQSWTFIERRDMLSLGVGL
ncbi:putative N-acetylgalactosaminyltransferase 9 [Tubulanus polymorphus]|uniref:putative N-acetylgalactosaminyltransferase 9 n=1 Tax=Tubulanus polymorphus TaxID=672921 RepID=UPI003DA3DB83